MHQWLKYFAYIVILSAIIVTILFFAGVVGLVSFLYFFFILSFYILYIAYVWYNQKLSKIENNPNLNYNERKYLNEQLVSHTRPYYIIGVIVFCLTLYVPGFNIFFMLVLAYIIYNLKDENDSIDDEDIDDQIMSYDDLIEEL